MLILNLTTDSLYIFIIFASEFSYYKSVFIDTHIFTYHIILLLVSVYLIMNYSNIWYFFNTSTFWLKIVLTEHYCIKTYLCAFRVPVPLTPFYNQIIFDGVMYRQFHYTNVIYPLIFAYT